MRRFTCKASRPEGSIQVGDEGMEDTGLESGGRERTLHDAVIAARAFDGDQAVADVVPREGVTDLSDDGKGRKGMSPWCSLESETGLEPVLG